MKVSVIIPLYNKQAWVADTIASLAVQSEPIDELIIVDDASIDDSVATVEWAIARHGRGLRDVRVELVRCRQNGGPGVARNVGIERASGGLIACLDADDRYRTDAVQRIRTCMVRHGLAMLAVGFASDPPGEQFPDLAELGRELNELDDEAYLLTDPLRTATHPEFFMGRASNVVVHRSWLADHRYCSHARLNEGIDLWYRVLKHVVGGEGRVGVLAAPLIHFRILDDSLSHRQHDDWRTLEVPPTVLRYIDDGDAHDRRLSLVLAQRWLDHAMTVLPDTQRRHFLAHHRMLLQQLEVSRRAKWLPPAGN